MRPFGKMHKLRVDLQSSQERVAGSRRQILSLLQGITATDEQSLRMIKEIREHLDAIADEVGT